MSPEDEHIRKKIDPELRGRAVRLVLEHEQEYATAGWVDWYNNPRIHSTLGIVPPDEYEQAHYSALNTDPQST